MYALIQNNSVVEYPYTEAQLRASMPQTSLPVNINLRDYGVEIVVVKGQPEISRFTQKAVEVTPTYNATKQQWEQTWEIVALTTEEQAAAVAGFQSDVVVQVQKRLDEFARTRNYDGILSAASYAVSSHPPFAGEGRYCADARDATWGALYQLMAAVESGTTPMPTSYAEVEPYLPVLAWP